MANPELTNAAVSVLLGENWKALPAAERVVYVEEAKKIKETFKAEHPEYRYARSSRTKGKKRKQDPHGEHAGGSSSAPEALSLHALALAGASLASPPTDAAPPGFFKPFTPAMQRGTASPVSNAPMSRSSSLSMLDQLCVIADGVQRVSPVPPREASSDS